MLVDTSFTVAYKCPFCGAYAFFEINLFNLIYKKQNTLNCGCGKSNIILGKESKGVYRIKLPCGSCGGKHGYTVDNKKLLGEAINIFCCPEKGIQQCFIGKDEHVREKIDHVEKELDELINRLGFDSYFENTQVMFDSLNKVHDIAEQGNLRCECGGGDIGMDLFSDRIRLKCNHCFAGRDILAASNEDLKNTLKQKCILLQGRPANYQNTADSKSSMT